MKTALTKTLDSTREDDVPTGAFKPVNSSTMKNLHAMDNSENCLRRSSRNARKSSHRSGYKKTTAFQQSDSNGANSLNDSQDGEGVEGEGIENNPYK